jgi:hypothetical protein
VIQAWSGLRTSGGRKRDLIVCGRKYCTGCGRWRLLVDFGRQRGRFRSRCRTCHNASERERHLALSDEQRERWREYQRIWHEAKRREAGVPERDYDKRSPVDVPERVFLERAPLIAELRLRNGEYRMIAQRSGVPARTITRLLNDGGRFVRLDVADKLAVALGVPLAVVYGGEIPTVRGQL